MANTNITIRIDEELKGELQKLMSNLGMDLTTFFTLAAKQAVREQALPFKPRMINKSYSEKAYQIAMNNTKYNSEGKPIIELNDEWRDETEWEEMYQKYLEEND